MLLALLLACPTSTPAPLDCQAGFVARDGACYERADTGAPEDTAADSGDTSTDTDTDTGKDPVDRDADGYPAGEDCDDGSNYVHPGAVERCDGHDDNCDGQVDEGLAVAWYPDVDGDGYGDGSAGVVPVEDCAQPTGTIDNTKDCDDLDPDVHPEAADDDGDGVDNDCDGSVDEDWAPCSTRYGAMDTTTYNVDGGYLNNAGTVSGDGYVCSFTCDKSWVTDAYLSASPSCATSPTLPTWNDPDLNICLDVQDGTVDYATCELSTSDGTKTFTVMRISHL